jgi:hypothetical protein
VSIVAKPEKTLLRAPLAEARRLGTLPPTLFLIHMRHW